MAKMTERMMELFDKVPVVVLSTTNGANEPNAIPVGTKKIIDPETILFSDQFFNKTIENLKVNKRVAVTFWEGAEGYQLKGTVTIETTTERYRDTAKWVEELSAKIGFPMKSKGAVIVKIDEIFGVSPGPGAGRKLA